MGSLHFLVLIRECWVCFYQKVDLFKIYRVGGLEELLIASRVEFWYANLGIFFSISGRCGPIFLLVL